MNNELLGSIKMTRNETAKNIHKMREYGRKVTASKAKAVDALKKAGIFTKAGTVAKPYQKLLKPAE